MKPMSKNQARRPLGVDPEFTRLDSMFNQDNTIFSYDVHVTFDYNHDIQSPEFYDFHDSVT